MRNSRQVWVPREGTRLNRFSKANETAGYVDLTNDPLSIGVPGTEFTASRMNSLEDGVDAFYHTLFSGLSAGALAWHGICSDPSGNIYATAYGGDIYKSTDGGATFSALGLASRYWFGICSNPSGNLYATVGGAGVGDIYKSTDGGATFTALGLTLRNYAGICSDPSGNLYATVEGGDIYKSTDDGVTFNALGLTSRAWNGICSDPSGNIYATVGSGDIYKSTDDGVTFNALGLTSRAWYGICSDPSGNIYATVGSGDIYKSTDDGVTFNALGFTSRAWYGICSDPSNNLFVVAQSSDIYKSSYLPITPSSVKQVEITTDNVTEVDNRFSTYRLTGALTGNRQYILPTDSRSYRIICDCTGSYYVHVKTASGTGVYLAPEDTTEVYCDGTNIKAISIANVTTTAEPLNEIITYAKNGKSLFYVPYNASGSTAHYPENNTIATNWGYEVDRKDDYITVKARSANLTSNHACYERKYNAPDWEGSFLQLTDASGNATRATHQLTPTTLNGSLSRASMYSAFVTALGAGGWTVAVQGGLVIPEYGLKLLAYATHENGSSTVYLWYSALASGETTNRLAIVQGDSAAHIVTMSF